MTANDSDVSDGDTLTGSQVVRVYGENLTSPFVTLTFGDVQYTPLESGEGYIEYLLGDNGTATISVDGSPLMSFEVEGIEVPSELPTRIQAMLYVSSQDYKDMVDEISTKCLNYPYMVDDTYTKVRLNIGSSTASFEDAQDSDFVGVNCTKVAVASAQPSRKCWLITPIDVTKPAYVTYKGFIVLVFNYPTE